MPKVLQSTPTSEGQDYQSDQQQINRFTNNDSTVSRIASSLVFFGAVSLNPGISWAQAAAEPGEESVEISDLSMQDLLDPNVTTASRLSEKATEAPATVYVVTKEDIHARGYSTLADVLKDVPGMETVEQYYSEQGTLVAVRGVVGNNKIVLLINGMRVNPPGGEELMIRNDVSVRFAEQIEIIYGPGSTLYGQDAISAVINIKTKKPSDVRAEVLAGYGNNDTKEGFASFATRIREDSDTPITITGFASYRSSDLANLKDQYKDWWTIYQPYLANIPGRADQFYRHDLGYSVFARIESKNASLQAWFRESERSTTEGSGEGGTNPVLWWVPEAKWRDRALVVEGQYAMKLSNHLTLRSIPTFNRYEVDPKSRYVFPNGMGGLYLNDFKYGIGTSAQLEEKFDFDFGEATRFALGFVGTHYDVIPKTSVPGGADPDLDIVSQAGTLSYYRVANDPNSRVDLHRAIDLHYRNIGVYGEGSHRIMESLKVIAGLRADFNSRYSTAPISPRAAVVYNGLGGKLALKYIFSMAYVAPAPYFGQNVFDNGVQISAPNPDLKPEKATSNEINATFKTNKLLMSASGYYNYQSNLLVTAQSELPETIAEQKVFLNLDGTGERLVRHSINLGNSQAYGADVFGRYNTGPISSWASYSYVDFKRTLGAEKSGLQQISHHNVRAGLTLSLLSSKILITPSLVLRSTPANLTATYDVPGVKMKTPYEVNFNALYAPIKYVDVFVTMRNITNNKYALRGVSGPALQEPIWGIAGVRLKY
jgi:outer membrane receptor protein involved in Fe transport